MTYLNRIAELTKAVSTKIVDFSIERDKARIPTQASSNFITNKQQGDWAEHVVMQAINDTFSELVCVHYGKSDDLIAGDDGFAEFYEQFQQELDTIGKRPDLLVFKKEDYCEDWGMDISHIPHCEMDDYVKQALCGIEVRSSAFLIEKYEAAIHTRVQEYSNKAFALKEQILRDYVDLLQVPVRCDYPVRCSYIDILQGLTADTICKLDFKVPGWRSSKRLIELNGLLKELKVCLGEVQKRDFLSITPKVEDLKVVYKWIQTFNVPHFYFQVFFDKVFGISFEDILRLLGDAERNKVDYFIEGDKKNQNKQTIKIRSQIATLIAHEVEEPQHESCRKEMARGRLLYYVTFKGGAVHLNTDNLKGVLGL